MWRGRPMQQWSRGWADGHKRFIASCVAANRTDRPTDRPAERSFAANDVNRTSSLLGEERLGLLIRAIVFKPNSVTVVCRFGRLFYGSQQRMSVYCFSLYMATAATNGRLRKSLRDRTGLQININECSQSQRRSEETAIASLLPNSLVRLLTWYYIFT